MRTMFIDASPKNGFHASSYFLGLQRLFVRGDVISERLRNRGDYKQILDKLPAADTVVFCLPLYVDGLPSHVLPFLKDMENFCKENTIRMNVYCIANNGFIEGRQNEALMRIFQNFCVRSGLQWCGGTGIGGGVMLNITRILFAVNVAVFCLNMAYCALQNGSMMETGIWRGFLTGTLILVFLNAGVLIDMFRMGWAVNKGCGSYFGEKYTRILLPSFVFILITDIFFTVTSVFRGGMFKGWLSKK